MREIIVKKLLSAVLQKSRKGSLENLRKVLLESEFSDNAEARKLVAYAHLACFSVDPRKSSFAIKTFSQLKDWKELANILRICKTYKVFKLVQEIKQIGEIRGVSELQFPGFFSWFKDAVRWFDVYESPDRFFFISEEDSQLIKKLASREDGFWDDVFSDSEFSGFRRELLEKLANGEKPVIAAINRREGVEQQFLEYCRSNRITVIRRMQKGSDSLDDCLDKCSYVYLVIDGDGIFKVYKELLDYKDRLIFEHEGVAYRHLPEAGFLPKCYGGPEGTVEIGGHKFLKLSVHFGQSLADYTKPENLLREDEASFVVGKIAEKLKFLYDNGILYLDLKPENILLNNGVKFLDLGIVKVLEPGKEDVDIFLADPRYVAPESGTQFKAGEASLVYQLGILFSQLLTGRHPFALVPELSEKEWESAILKYAWPSIMVQPDLSDIRKDIVVKMLEKDPSKRPGLADVADSLTKKSVLIKQKGREKRRKERNTILFIGRMGIPHKGHLEYISRFLEMGFFVKIAISKAYTLTSEDPIPKWIVMKMIAQSLIYRGFSSDDFELILTPFYETDQEMQMHFLMIPGREDVVGVASSNPSVMRLFQDKCIFDQRSVFGYEEEKYHDLSWGKIIRKAVREGDYLTFNSYAARGVEDILTFSKIRESYGKPEIEFVSGKVIAVLLNSHGELARGRVLKYLTPEQSLVFHLRKQGHLAEITDPYSSVTGLVLNNVGGKISYEGVQIKDRDEIISFRFEED